MEDLRRTIKENEARSKKAKAEADRVAKEAEQAR